MAVRGGFLALCGLVALGGCSGVGGLPQRPLGYDATRLCNAKRVDALIGAVATAELGSQLLKRSGARSLRWVAPNSIVTTDYQAARLNVAYDADYRIKEIACG